MAVSLEDVSVRWTAGASPEPYAAVLFAADGNQIVFVNERLATQPAHHAAIARWYAHHRHQMYARLTEAELLSAAATAA